MLKGKTLRITVYEPLNDEDTKSERVAQYLAAYALMDAESAEAKNAFIALKSRYPDDPLANFHVRRLEAGETGSLVVMRSK